MPSGVASTVLFLVLLPCAIKSLRIRESSESDFLEADGYARVGDTLSSSSSSSPYRRLKRSPPPSETGEPSWVSHEGGTTHNHSADEEGNEWPDTWLHALEQAHILSHTMDNDTLWKFTHATTGPAPEHYQAETITQGEPGHPHFIPALKMQHAVPGFQPRTPDEKKRVTAFPSYLCLASSWDKSLVFRVAMAVAKEFKTLGANVMFGPAINIHRATQHDEEFDSLSGEDPTLGAVLVRSWILATQTHGIMTVPKYLGAVEQTPVHFENTSANVTAWDIYYPPIVAAADTGAAGFMCASHEVNGLWSCRDPDILVRDLRHIMSFHGMVVSDNNSAREYFEYASSFERGLDLEVAEEVKVKWSKHLEKGMREGAQRVLAAIWHMRIEQHPGCQPPHCKEALGSTATTAEHKSIARQAAACGVVLLKNEDGILPLTKATLGKKQIAVIDATTDYCGSDSEECQTPYQAIASYGESKNITVVGENAMAEASTFACIILGESTASTHWRVDKGTETRIKLASSTCEYTIAFLQTKGTVLTPWRDDLVGLAILHATGEEAAFAWACVLFGDCNPSGKLTISMAEKEEDKEDWWNEQVPSYWDPSIEFAYPFGYGLSYAEFAYTNFKDKPGCKAPLCIQLDVTNVSPIHAGQEVVQVYFKFGELEHHPMVLRGFHKTKLLEPGEFERVFFPFSFRDLSLYHDVGNHTEPEASWHPELSITLLVGSSSRDIKWKRVEHPRGVWTPVA